jgi:hypothetical protein
MNKKASNSAINNKLFLGFWFVLFAALVLMVNWLFHIPVTKADELITRLADTDKQLTRLKAIHAEFLLSHDKEDNLFTTEGNPVENEANAIIVTIKNTIENLKTNNQLTKKPAVLASLNEFSTILTEFRNDLQDLFMVSRELGDKNSGLVSRWLGLSKGMLAASNKPNEDVLRKLNQIKQFESEYLLYRDIRTLENISNTVEEIRSQLTSDEGGINLQDIDSYMVLTGNLMVIEKRMGHTGTQGIVPDLEKSIKKLPVAFDTADTLIKKSLVKTAIWWTIARYIVILLVVAIYIYLFIKVFSRSEEHTSELQSH